MAEDSRRRFGAGERVVVLTQPIYGVEATVVRPARLLWKRAWLVELDLGRSDRFAIRRTRVVENALAPVEQIAVVRADAPARRAASAKFAFSCLVPGVAVVWALLPWPLAITFDIGLVVLALVGFSRGHQKPEVLEEAESQ